MGHQRRKQNQRPRARLVQTFELGGGLEFAVEVAVDDLHEEFAEIGESGCGDGFVGEASTGCGTCGRRGRGTRWTFRSWQCGDHADR